MSSHFTLQLKSLPSAKSPRTMLLQSYIVQTAPQLFHVYHAGSQSQGTPSNSSAETSPTVSHGSKDASPKHSRIFTHLNKYTAAN